MAKPLPHLEDLLWEWLTVQERSLRLWKEDALWWYGERASVGAFAGAVWRSGGMVLEEYSTKKQSGSQSGSKARNAWSHGRGDMDFALGGKKYMIEAKQCWPCLGSGQPLRWVKDAMVKAEADIRRVRVEKEYNRLAVVFASPGCTRHKHVDTYIRKWIEDAQLVEGWARAWVFPADARCLQSEKNRRYYPGAALFIKQILA